MYVSYNFNRSVNRAINLMHTPSDYDNYIVFKIKPLLGGCCCFHCYPELWKKINSFIEPFGPIEDEGDVLIGNDNNKFVLECHESGPEIITYIDVAGDLFTIITPIVGLIAFFIKRLQKEPGKQLTGIRVTKRIFENGNVIEEKIIEVKSALSDEIIKVIESGIRESIKRKRDTHKKRQNITKS